LRPFGPKKRQENRTNKKALWAGEGKELRTRGGREDGQKKRGAAVRGTGPNSSQGPKGGMEGTDG